MWRTSLMICAALAIGGCASAPAPRADLARSANNSCVPQGLRAGQNRCPAGRSFTQEDIQRTGQANVGDALPMLDPSITVHH